MHRPGSWRASTRRSSDTPRPSAHAFFQTPIARRSSFRRRSIRHFWSTAWSRGEANRDGLEGGGPRAQTVRPAPSCGSRRAARRGREADPLHRARRAAPRGARVKRAAAELPVLSLRELNRATLARQLLLERGRLDVVRAVEHLAGLQAQWAPSPYIALWSRLAGFARERLWSAIERHAIVRARLMRGTLHLVSARDFYAYAVATQDLQRGAWNRVQVGRGVDPQAVATLAIAFAREPRRKDEVLAHITARLGKKLGGPYSWLIWRFVSAHADLVNAPPGGHWAYGGTDAPYVAAHHWIDGAGRPAEEDALELLIRRYLGAFGPASLADVARFAGQVAPRIRPALERLAARLVTLRAQARRLLFDLPPAPRPPPRTPPPLPFLPRY